MGNPFTVRLRNQNTGKIIFKDLIYGEIVILNSEIDDFIIAIMKSSISEFNITISP